MPFWKTISLMDTDNKTQIGGAIVDLKSEAITGPLDAISVSPASIEETSEGNWNQHLGFVKLQVTDRVVWLDSSDTESLVNLLQLAREAARRNADKAQIGPRAK